MKDEALLNPLESVFGKGPNPVYSDASDVAEYQKAQQTFLDALQMRYSQPNWFKVAAGLAKPQLGGFMASLGSGAEALGENVEQQRQNLLPMAQLRAQMASYNATLGKQKKAGLIFANALGIDPKDAESVMSGNKPLPPGAHKIMPAETAGLLNILDPTGTGSAATKMVEMAQREAEITQKANAGAIENANYFQKYGKNIPGFVPTGSGDPRQQGNNPLVVPPSGANNISNIDTSAAPNPFIEPSQNVSNEPRSSGPEINARVETGNRNGLVSPKGAEAAMQVMPKTQKNPGYGVVPAKDNSDAEINRVGVDYWNAMKDKFGSSLLADVAYNWGPGNTEQWVKDGADWKKLPTETKNYISQTSLLRDQPSAKAAAESKQSKPAITFAGQGNPVDTSMELSKESQKAVNLFYEPKINNIITRGDPKVVSDNETLHRRLLELGSTPGVIKGTGLLYKDQGFLAGLKTLMAEGIQGGINTSGGGFSMSLSAPIEKVISKLDLNPDEQQQLREFALLNAQRTGDDLAAAIRSSSGGGHANIAEFQTGLSRITNSSDPHKILMSDITRGAIENERLGKEFELLGDYQNNPTYANKPPSSFFHSRQYTDLIKDYAPKIKSARRLAN
jgi:Transglycosylase SLT domain